MVDDKSALRNLISPGALNALAGSKTFQFGKRYLDDGAVRNLSATANAIHAQVEGTASYRVVLGTGSGKLAADCSCPHADEGYFCKHCVAVGLAWLAIDGATEPFTNEKQHDTWRDIQAYLRGQEIDALVALVLDAARGDQRLFRALSRKAERALGGADFPRTLRKAIDQATRSDGYVAWDEVDDFLDALHEVADSLKELLQPATSATLLELLDYFIERVEARLEEVDDSDGGMDELLTHLGELHLEACRMAKPEPIGLAERLFRLEMTLPIGIYSLDPLAYHELLGAQGVDRFRQLALETWRKVASGSADAVDEPGRTAIAYLMEGLAKESGDIEQLVELKSRNLSRDYHYLDIAELWHKAGQVELALEWAERGLAAFPDLPCNRLRDFLVGIYLARGREDEALQLTWIQFEEQQLLGNYKKLAQVAGKVARWHEQRERALMVVDAGIAARAIERSKWARQPTRPDYSSRVEIALWEQDHEAAWQYANQGVCERRLLIELAGELAKTQLDRAVELYRRVVPAVLEKANNRAYEEAIGLVRKMANALSAHQRRDELSVYLGHLRVEFKRKRNFIKMLDQFAG